MFLVSIHAPPKERDVGISYHNIGMMCVSIHAPLKERDIAEIDAAELKLMFQSARPRRGATPIF